MLRVHFAIYEIPCLDCDQVYIGETKRSFSTRQKEHKRDVRNAASGIIKDSSTALCKHATFQKHELDWQNSKILDFETDYRKRRFIESFFIKQKPNVMNDKKTVFLSPIYNKFKFISES